MANKLVATQSHTPTDCVPASTEISIDLMQPELNETPAAPVVARPRCIQCNKTLRHMPMFLGNITCRDCYGAERYSRGPGVPIGGTSLSAPVINNTYTA